MTFNVQETRPDLLCSTDDQRRALASAILRVLRTQLRFNICDLPTSYLRNAEMPNLQWRLDTYIPDYLTYSSRFWADHLVATSYNSDIAREVGKFLVEQFLFWLEVLSLRGDCGVRALGLVEINCVD
ncbi:hypothetical protein C8R44DRAFT_799694 [Mycena epipterygia]|nr:hypothetical protein C8R44DRAFT_799694 [Mycena epipterygia]